MEESEKLEEPCRLCDENAEKLVSIFDKNEEGVEILQVIKDCIPIVIYRTDPLSKNICESCLESLYSLSSFKKNCEEIAHKQKEKLGAVPNKKHQAFLACGERTDEISELQDASTSTDDINTFCNNCKQSILDGNLINGELELAIAESLAKNKMRTESAEKSLRRRKVVPFYHELDDSLCSSLTEYTQNTEGSQMFEDNSDIDGSDDDSDVAHSRKKRRIMSDEEDAEDSERNGRKDGSISNLHESKPLTDEDFAQLYQHEECHRYQPFSLLQLALNVINVAIVQDYQPDDFLLQTVTPECRRCNRKFRNLKVLSIHEKLHMEVEAGEKIDNPLPWHDSRENADVRNKWLNYFDENGYEDDDIIIDDVVSTSVCNDNLLIPLEECKTDSSGKLTGEEKLVLVGTQPMVNGVYLGDYSKDERKLLYQTMRIQGVNKKFCPLCRYTFKDNWAIESHYFSLACYYTCRYCGMRFNKQRHKFKEHVDEHEANKDDFSEKIFAANKLSNVIPKVIHPPKPRRIVVTQHNPPPEMVAANNQFFSGPSVHQQQMAYSQQPKRSFMERKTLQPNLQNVVIKEEPQDNREIQASQSKTGNQAYFCRKCYKVFFKLDEFNIHSKNCDFAQFPQARNNSTTVNKAISKNGDVSPAGRPIRNCAKEVGPYKDDVYLPEHIMKDPKSPAQQSTFVCFICNTPFPTIYSRNSHMRIHKGETQGQLTLHQPPPTTTTVNNRRPANNQLNYRQPPPPQSHYLDAVVKQEPLDMETMEPMVEIHEQEQEQEQQTGFPTSLGEGAVSITPIVKNPKQKATINASVMKIVQSNPNLSIKKAPEKIQSFAPTTSYGQMPLGVAVVAPPDPDRSYKCSSCWEAFANKSHLYFHKKNQCEGSRLPCPFCKKRFGTEAEYSSHIYYSHPE
ncbi:unnamed protein product [Phyllotreta striolata]|uniref:Uncharacterized protein n=1 Tax=Phyllotreta striolata TaxID=444603 RepID=A0A9N9TZ26_PHYSR|nr:unnamed protein product [Phyllotreta striolata]